MTTVRSLADDLRQRADGAIADLLRQRPDLIHPVPPDLTALAARATTGPSVARCIDAMDAMHLHVLRTAAEASREEPTTDARILELSTADLPAEASSVAEEALADLVRAALLWGTSDERRAVHAAHDLVADAPPPRWPPPQLAGDGERAAVDIDALAAVSARETLERIRDLLDDWSIRPPSVLRSGGLSLRDFAAARTSLHSDWACTSLTIEAAAAARLLADSEEDPPHWVPTDHYDTWLTLPTPDQWIAIVRAWLTLPRLPSLAHEKTQVLSAEQDRRAVPVLRREVLDLLVQAPVGASVDEESIRRVLDERRPRRAGELRTLTIRATLVEAAALGLVAAGSLSQAALGLVAAGSLSQAARLLLGSRPGRAAERRSADLGVSTALAEALPPDVDHVLIQADLTIVAPGSLTLPVARSLRVVADVVSRGHATVYRMSEATIRRALDSGWDATAIHELLGRVSSTPVPQPLTYLIDDVARRHGTARVGGALAYLRSDDRETLTRILADRRLSGLGLARIADTVVVSQATAAELLTALRSAGYAPAAEAPDGRVLVRRPEDRRTRAPRAAAQTPGRGPDDALVTAAVRSLRAGDRAGSARLGASTPGPAGTIDLARLSSVATVNHLRSAIADARPVWIGYADNDGGVTVQIVDPIRLSAGSLIAFDRRTEQVRTFAVSRMTGIADLT